MVSPSTVGRNESFAGFSGPATRRLSRGKRHEFSRIEDVHHERPDRVDMGRRRRVEKCPPFVGEGHERHPPVVRVGHPLDDSPALPIERDGQPIGHMTHQAWSYRMQRMIGYALVSVSASVGDTVHVRRAGQTHRGELRPIPFAL